MFSIADMPPYPGLPVDRAWGGALLAFVLTVAMEWPLLAWWSGRGLRRTGLFCLLINGVSWGFSMGLLALMGLPVPLIEVGVILVEAGLLLRYYKLPWLRALSISAGMNLVSWLLGTPLLYLLMGR